MNNQIGFICVNFLRPDATKNCILSLKECFPDVSIYVADQDAKTEDMETFYQEYNVNYSFVEYDWGLSNCRNFLLEKVKEPYVMWGDNDFIFIKESNLNNALTLLQNIPKIGIVGGMIIKNGLENHYEHYLVYDKNTQSVIIIPIQYLKPEEKRYKGILYYDADLIYNFAVAPQKLFKNKKVRWNKKIKVCFEHEDFFLRVKVFSNLKVLYTPSMKVIHKHTGGAGYQTFRSRRVEDECLSKFWNLKHYITVGENTVKFYKDGGFVHLDKDLTRKLQTTKSNLFPDVPEKIITTTIKNTESIIKESPVSNNLMETLKILNRDELFWFLNLSCLEMIKQHTIVTKKLFIGVQKEEVKSRINSFLLNSKLNIEWEIRVEQNRQIKKCDVFNVPCPVVKYLEKTFNKSWEELQRGV